MHKTTGRWKLGLALALTTALLWSVLPIALKLLLGQMDERRLGDVVNADVRMCTKAANRRDVDDDTAVLFHVLVPAQLAEHQGSGQVDFERLVPAGEVSVDDWSVVGPSARVVHQDVDAAETLHACADDPFGVFGVADMASFPDAADLICRVLARFGLAARDHDLGTGLDERFGDRLADPARTAGHECCLSVKSKIHIETLELERVPKRTARRGRSL